MKLRNKKTGEHGEYKVVSAGYLIRVRDCDTNESYQYDCIAGFNEDWEDYEPVEPLIKDEKIRKVVRAWAEVNGFNSKMFFTYYANLHHLSCWKASIEFSRPIDGLEDGKDYYITELCGEEEE